MRGESRLRGSQAGEGKPCVSSTSRRRVWPSRRTSSFSDVKTFQKCRTDFLSWLERKKALLSNRSFQAGLSGVQSA